MKAQSEDSAGTVSEMKNKSIPAIVIIVALLAVLGGMAISAQDKYTLKAPNGVAFSEFRGYETWPVVALSHADEHGLKAILGNPAMINAYKEGIPGNGKPFPDGVVTAKITWSVKKNPAAPFAVVVPDTLKMVEFILKDSRRFPETSGWGYARFVYDAASDTFKPYGKDSSFGKECYACHTIVKARDYIFTDYPRR